MKLKCYRSWITINRNSWRNIRKSSRVKQKNNNEKLINRLIIKFWILKI